MNKKAEMGVGTLIIFIAMLLVAAVAAGVLIQTVGSLQERSLTTGQQAEGQISTNADFIEISATDGRDTNITDFQALIKLSPGSDPIKLDEVLLTFNTQDDTATIKYRGTNSICKKNNVDGYNTWETETLAITSTSRLGNDVNNYTLEEDLDDDGADDYVYLGPLSDESGTNYSYLYVNLSTAGVINYSLGADMANLTSAITLADISRVALSNGTQTFAYLTLTSSGTQFINNTINENATIIIEPYKLGQGYFSVSYEQQDTNWVDGNMQRGDIIKACFESPGDVGQAEEIRLNFIPKVGTPTTARFFTPDVISSERVYLYP